MPQKNSGREDEAAYTDKVTLKPILGVRPGVYLAFIYGAVLVVILFFILLFPGISRPGSVIVVKSEPWGAAVLVDGVYSGAAPCEVFVAKGPRRIELSLPGFTAKQIERNFEGRLFASLIFPLKIEINEKLSSPAPAEAFIDEAAEYAAWSFTGEPNQIYQIPLSLSEGVYRLGNQAEREALDAMNDTIRAASRFAVTRAGLRDLLRAKSLLDNRGLSPSPVSLLASAGDLVGFLEENPQAALWLGSLLTGDAQSDLVSSQWYQRAGSAEGRTVDEVPALESANTIQAGFLSFRMIPGGHAGANFPPGTRVETFYIAETVVSKAAWEAFLESQPRWNKENAETLIREGLVKEEYLEMLPATFGGATFSGASGATEGGSASEEIAGVSWYAARAFCEWLSQSADFQSADFQPVRFQHDGEEWELRLPTEAEWEHAANAGALDSGRFWEWCEDQYAPLSFLSAPALPSALPSPERSLRGGSWVNSTGSVNNERRASLPPSFCSPFVSFRPVIAPFGVPKDAPGGGNL